MHERAHTKLMPIVRLPRMVAGEWRCRDCGHLSYGAADDPRCPNCFGRQLVPTVERPAGAIQAKRALS